MATPSNLTHFISNENIKKVGRMVNGDLKKLVRDKCPNTIIRGGVELGKLAKEKGVIEDGRAGLNELCKKVLKKCLCKDSHVRLSNWEKPSLEKNQKMYAALDAWASLQLYNIIDSMVNESAFLKNPEATVGTLVKFYRCGNGKTLYLGDGQIVDPPGQFRPRKGFAFVKVLELKATHFKINYITANIIKWRIHELVKLSREANMQIEVEEMQQDDCEIELLNLAPLLDNAPEQLQENASLRVKARNLREYDSEDDTDSDDLSPEIVDDAVGWTANSRVLQDPWHLMDRINIRLSHGAAKDFMRKFRDTLFKIDPNDKALIESYLSSNGESFEKKFDSDPNWILSRVKRRVPSRVQLVKELKTLFEVYGKLSDAKRGDLLFSKQNWLEAQQVLKLCSSGLMSDPPDVQLYYHTSTDSNGLPLYRCIRGTNDIEGGVHQKIRRKFGAFNAGPRLADCLLAEFRQRHNITVGSKNREKCIFYGHFDTWLIDRLKFLEDSLDNLRIEKDSSYKKSFSNWISVSDFESTNESFGICKLPLEENYILRYQETIKLGESFKYVAKMMDSRYPILPIHTKEEIELFGDLIKEKMLEVEMVDQVNWVEICDSFNQQADGKTIFYKVRSQIVSYYNQVYKKKQISSITLRDSHQERNTLKEKLIRSNIEHLPPVQGPSIEKENDKGKKRAIPENSLLAPPLETRLAPLRPLQPSLQPTYIYPQYQYPVFPFPPPFLQPFQPFQPMMQQPIINANKKKKEKRCKTCGITDCNGRGRGNCETSPSKYVPYRKNRRN